MFRALASKMCRANQIAICQSPIPVIVPKLSIFLKKWEVLIWKCNCFGIFHLELRKTPCMWPNCWFRGCQKSCKRVRGVIKSTLSKSGMGLHKRAQRSVTKAGPQKFLWAFSSHLRTPKVHKVTQKVQQIQKPKPANGFEFSLLTDSTEISSYLNDVYAGDDLSGDRDQCGQRHQMATSCPQF